MVNDQVPFISTITDVREVGLTGTADLAYWGRHVHEERLTPLDHNGRAAILLTAIASKFRGITFRELSISVLLADGGAFLAHAFNSSRPLAFAERVLFQTPYQLAALTVDEGLPARMEVSKKGRFLFGAAMGDHRPPSSEHDVVFDGPIYLPGGKIFHARLSGKGAIYPYHASDVVRFGSSADEPVFTRLRESGFVGHEWLVRAGAVHARSKTYKR